ncbi:MAG TPA: arginase family protein [Thermoanaerobaculia bacterium]|nr:arginase family protein [Thermoanaerobaculia bacterium]
MTRQRAAGRETEGLTLEAIVVPYEVDRDDTGMARGPAGLLERGLLDFPDASVSVLRTEVWSRIEPTGTNRARIVAELGRVTARAVATAHGRGRFPLILAGGCLSAVGVVAGLQRMGRELGAVWVDAHGDFNTPESSPSGYWDGMALAAVCGRSLPQVYQEAELRPLHHGHIVHLGGRAFDPPEVDDFRRLNVAVVAPEAVGAEGGQREVARLSGETGEIYLHVDLDGLDPRDAPAVNRPVPLGPRADDLLRCLAGPRRFAALTLTGMDFDRVDEAHAELTVETCRRLLEALVLDRAAGDPSSGRPGA